MEFLRDSIWQFVGVIIGLASVGVGIWIYLLQRKKKGLAYRILARNELLTANEEIRGRVKVLFDKKPVQDVILLVVQISNNGNLPILPSDFFGELTIAFEETTKILSVEITKCSPTSFKPELVLRTKSISILPTLINSKDFLTIKFLLSQYKDEIKIRARIVGAEEVREIKDTGKMSQNIELFTAIFLSVLITIIALCDLQVEPVVYAMFFLVLGYSLIRFGSMISKTRN